MNGGVTAQFKHRRGSKAGDKACTLDTDQCFCGDHSGREQRIIKLRSSRKFDHASCAGRANKNRLGASTVRRQCVEQILNVSKERFGSCG